MGRTSAYEYPLFLFSSKYSQRMRKLSCKIFNEFYVPELPKRELDHGMWSEPIQRWLHKWHSDLRTWERCQERPSDLNSAKNHNYYPSHPQIRELTGTLREYGLYRDEHRDFNEEMKAITLARGKDPRPKRGPYTEKSKK